MSALYARDAQVDLLKQLISAARDHYAGIRERDGREPDAEYLRGMAALIASVCRLGIPEYSEAVVSATLTGAIAGEHVTIVGQTFHPDF